MAEEGSRSLQMLASALEKEQRGLEFYKTAESKCANELGEDIFRMLAAEEGVHITRIKEIYTSLEGGKAWPGDWKSHKMENENLQKLFRERMAGLGSKVGAETGDLEALNVGIELEQGAINFYEQELTRASDQLEREFIEQMIREERSHYQSLSEIKQYLTDPESWFAEMERHGLDGA